MKRAVQPLHPTDTLTPIENKQPNKTNWGWLLKLKKNSTIYFRKVLFSFKRVLSYHLIRVPWKGSGSFPDSRLHFAHFPCRADMVLMLYGTALFWMKITDLRLLFISTNAFNRSNYRFHSMLAHQFISSHKVSWNNLYEESLCRDSAISSPFCLVFWAAQREFR